MTIYTYRVIVSHNSANRGNLRRGDRFASLEPVTSPHVELIEVFVEPEPKKRRTEHVKSRARQDSGTVLRAEGSRKSRFKGGTGDDAGQQEDGAAQSGTPVGVKGSEAGTASD